MVNVFKKQTKKTANKLKVNLLLLKDLSKEKANVRRKHEEARRQDIIEILETKDVKKAMRLGEENLVEQWRIDYMESLSSVAGYLAQFNWDINPLDV